MVRVAISSQPKVNNGVAMSGLSDLDTLLSVIENPTRRRILEALVREPHYSLQLSKELGMSQQAIMKHMKVLEESDFVRSYPEESDQGGPTRKLYVPTTKFTIIVDFGPGLFNTAIIRLALDQMSNSLLDMHPHAIDRSEQEKDEDLVDVSNKVLELRETVAQVDRKLDGLQQQRAALIETKEKALEEAGRVVEEQIDDYQARRIIYEFIQKPELELEELALDLGVRDDLVRRTLGRINRRG
jgi:predicted transcriptional regulator